MKKVLIFLSFLIVSGLSSCTKSLFKDKAAVVDNSVNFGIISKTNQKQEYEEFFLKIDGKDYNWKITEPGKQTVKRFNLEKGIYNYELTVKSMINSSAGRDLIVGTSSGKLSLENSKDLELVWDKKLKDNVYKVSLK